MRGYTEVTTQVEMDALLARVSHFHDSLTKELHLANRAWVAADRSMMTSHRFDARLLVHSQSGPLAIELLFIGIERLALDGAGEYWGASGSVVFETTPVERKRVTLSFNRDAFGITAERLYFIEHPSWTGPRARFGDEVPHPDCVPATSLDERWRQCSSCGEATEAAVGAMYCLCSGCGAMMELVEDEDLDGGSAAQSPQGA
jgi:hypothetical protein